MVNLPDSQRSGGTKEEETNPAAQEAQDTKAKIRSPDTPRPTLRSQTISDLGSNIASQAKQGAEDVTRDAFLSSSLGQAVPQVTITSPMDIDKPENEDKPSGEDQTPPLGTARASKHQRLPSTRSKAQHEGGQKESRYHGKVSP